MASGVQELLVSFDAGSVFIKPKISGLDARTKPGFAYALLRVRCVSAGNPRISNYNVCMNTVLLDPSANSSSRRWSIMWG